MFVKLITFMNPEDSVKIWNNLIRFFIWCEMIIIIMQI